MSALDNVLGRLGNVRQEGDGHKARCPCPDHGQGHGDRNPSLSIGADDEGNVLLRCFAGCPTEAVVDAMGLKMGDLFKNRNGSRRGGSHAFPKQRSTGQPATLANYVAYLELPESFLKGSGLREYRHLGEPAVSMPYLDETGEEVLLTRSRVSLTGSPKVKTRKGDKHRLYGLWKLEEAREADYVWVVEGESDSQTLWYHGEPAVGIPGANGWKAEWASDLEGVGKIYVVVEDEAGEALWCKLAATPELRERLYRVEFEGVKDVSELHTQDPKRFGERLEAARKVARPTGEPGDDWEDPAPLPDGLPPVAPFDPALLPDALRPWCEDIAERMQVPLDYVAVGAVAVAASLVGRRVGIRPKRYDDWLVVANLWVGIIGPPSAMKSPALAEVVKPLDRLVAEAREAHEGALADHAAEAEAIEAEKAAMKKAIDAAAKKSVETGDRSRLDNLIDRRRNMVIPSEPKERRYKTSDTTIEKLVEILRDNPSGILVQRDELTGWLRGLDRQGREVDRAFYLESWNGTGSYTVDRIGRGTLHVEALCISLLGGIQPGPLRSYVYGASRGGEGADGLLQRFQLLVWPDPPSGPWRNVDRYPDGEAKNRAYAVYEALDVLDPEKCGAVAEREGDIPTVGFSPEAQGVFDAWRHELEAKLRNGEASEAFVSHLAKYRSLMPSLTLVFHLVGTADGTADAGGRVGVASAARAAAWCEYLEGHARRVYASGENPPLEGARALLARIRKGDVKDGDAVRSVYRGRQWSRLSTSEEVNAAATLLEDYGWLRVEKAETGGRPTTLLRLHPSLKEEI